MREGLVELVVSAAAAAASFLDVVHVAVDRLPMVAGHETPAGESCKTEQMQERHRWSPGCDMSNRCATP